MSWQIGPSFPSVISRLSTEYVIVPVSFMDDGEVVNPTGYGVQIAFTSGYGVTPSAWVTGSWDPSPLQGIYYFAKVLVGPGAGGTALTSATYTTWTKIQDGQEVPVTQTGTLVIQ
jgi:hypothetical protein